MCIIIQHYNGWHSKSASGAVRSTRRTGRVKNRTGDSSHNAQIGVFAAKCNGLFACLFVCLLFVCLFVYLFFVCMLCLFVCLFVCLHNMVCSVTACHSYTLWCFILHITTGRRYTRTSSRTERDSRQTGRSCLGPTE